ncbi:uncharacterized protein J4E88_001241 [Alternaria novae-zelandiae]|uniref:uncharacterized protein n=1 Tax=Alternaria novae-zelandiae TaxID=430562 RepID=UPI0020C5134D|nr:uncharacterized protein J4E88_001241 [Alternaria novae-zelandiae]KAI4692871.1 hypothetical protein J4E88_001241 [Alternaria novae-zelandiae]
MPFLPPGDSPHITAGFSSSELASWIDNRTGIPATSPHTRIKTQFGCTINRSFNVQSTRTVFLQGMQGHLIEEKVFNNEKKAKIFIEGVTGSYVLNPQTQERVWVNNIWVSANDVWKGKRWVSDIKDWPIYISLDAFDFNAIQWMRDTPDDQSTLGRTIHALLTAFHDSPADFMGPKYEDIVKKRSIDSITKTIIKGIREAGLYDTLNNPGFRWQDLVGAATHVIDDYTQETGGVYMRVHLSDSVVPYWKPNTYYVYVGKTVNFYHRSQSHKSATNSRYGDLTRNSASLDMFAMCVLSEDDIPDLAHVVEQIFVCLCQTYRKFLFSDRVASSGGSGILSAIGYAKYFTDIARNVFERTGWHGAVSREGFGAYQGANFSSPLQEWTAYTNRILFLRTDTRTMDKASGRSTPVAIFRSANPRKLSHAKVIQPGQTKRQLAVWEKMHGKQGIRLSFWSDSKDGTKAPLANVPYHLVVEVYKDGSRHPHAWSRLSGIGPFSNWTQASSFAIRIEWEHPPNSGQWRYRYFQTSQMFRFVDTSVPGALRSYATAISFLQWLFGKAPNHSLPWIPRLSGRAYVLLADFDLHNQMITIKRSNEPFIIQPSTLRPSSDILRELKSSHLQLQNVGGEFGKFSTRSFGGPRKQCDVCTMLPDVAFDNGVFKRGCKRVGNSNVCQVCEMLGRPCCTWTGTGGIRGPGKFTTKEITGAAKDAHGLSAEDVAHWKIVHPALINQFYSISGTANQHFSNKLAELDLSGPREEDPSDIQVTSDEPESDESDDLESADDGENEF